jgi:hypothetical protein
MRAVLYEESRKTSAENVDAKRFDCPTDVRLTTTIEKVVASG